MPSSFPLPFRPRHLLVGAAAHEEIIAWIRSRRPDLEFRGALPADVTGDDLTWAEAYIGFRRPLAAVTMGNVRWVHCTGAGVDAWLADGWLDPTILLTRSTESFGPRIAEWALARVLAFQQQLHALAEEQHAGRWAPRDLTPLAGTRALVVGTGHIGRAVGQALAALGVTVTGVSRSGASVGAPFSAVYPVSALPSLVGETDWIVLVIPSTMESKHLFSRELLSRCRGAVLLNAGRGAVLDEAALVDALDQGWLRGAALDVFEREPLPENSPLWTNPRVMISPHMSGPTTVEGAGAGFVECLEALQGGVVPKWRVNRSTGY